MLKKVIPVIYWPTKIVFIDDDYPSSKLISRLFRSNATVIFSNPNEGIKFINENTTRVSDEEEHAYDLEESAEKNQFFAIKSLYKKIYKPIRFDEISTLVIDYDMPQCDGLSAIEKIVNSGIKKILLTGVADEAVAVEAFNQGKINRYVKKLEENADLKLREHVAALQMDYFIEKANKITERNPILRSTLENSFVIDVFSKLVKEKNVIEFYLIDEFGSFLMVDIKGDLFAFILHSTEVLEGVEQLIAGMDGIKKSDIAKLQNRQKLVPYRALEAIESKKSNVNEYLLDCQQIGNTEYYYAVTSVVSFLEIEQERLKFFTATESVK